MPTAYKVMGKPHRRTTRVPQRVTYADGSTGVVYQAGPMATYMVGDVIEDITISELTAFPDRFQPATTDEVKAFKERQAELAAPFVADVDMDEREDKAAQTAKLEAQILDLQAKLALVKPTDPGTAMREHAPVDPVSSEQAAREREAVRQVTTAQEQHAADEAAHPTARPGRNVLGGERSEAAKK